MTIPDFILPLFYAVDQEMLDVPQHQDAELYLSGTRCLARASGVRTCP